MSKKIYTIAKLYQEFHDDISLDEAPSIIQHQSRVAFYGGILGLLSLLSDEDFQESIGEHFNTFEMEFRDFCEEKTDMAALFEADKERAKADMPPAIRELMDRLTVMGDK